MQKTNLKVCTPESFKYDKVTRGRANRDLLDGKECQQCINYYRFLYFVCLSFLKYNFEQTVPFIELKTKSVSIC